MNNDTPQNPPPANAFSPGQSPAQRLLARLDGVRQSAIDRWLAPCPAHADRSPSLSIREMPDGTLLIKCFAGCGAADVVAAVGLDLRDLFPNRPENRKPLPRGQRRIPAQDALEIVAHEALVVGIIASDFRQGRALDEPTRERLAEAVAKITSAMEAAR